MRGKRKERNHPNRTARLEEEIVMLGSCSGSNSIGSGQHIQRKQLLTCRVHLLLLLLLISTTKTITTIIS